MRNNNFIILILFKYKWSVNVSVAAAAVERRFERTDLQNCSI